MLNASPAATKCLVGKIRTGLVEAKKFVEDDLKLVISKSGFHAFDVVNVWQVRDVVEERWCGPAADFLMDLEGCSAAKFPGIQYECSGDGTIAFEGFGEKCNCQWGAPWVVPGVGSRCVGKGGNEICGPGAFPEVFAMWAVG